MKFKSLFYVTFSVASLAVILLTGCKNRANTDSNTALVGKWYAENNSELEDELTEKVLITFKDDGTYVWEYSEGEYMIDIDGKWSTDGNKIHFTYNYENIEGDKYVEEDNGTFAINGNILTVNYEDGDIMEITKIN